MFYGEMKDIFSIFELTVAYICNEPRISEKTIEYIFISHISDISAIARLINFVKSITKA